MAKPQPAKQNITRKELLILTAIGAGVALTTIILVDVLNVILYIARFFYEGNLVPPAILGGANSIAIMSYSVLILAVAGLSALIGKLFGYTKILAAAIIASCVVIFFTSVSQIFFVVNRIELVGYGVNVVLGSVAFVGTAWISRRTHAIVTLLVALVLTFLTPTLQLTAVDLANSSVTDDQYFGYVAEEAQKENPFDAYVYAGGSPAEFKDAAWPYVEQQFSLQVSDSTVNLTIRQNTEKPSDYEISTTEYCQIKDYFEGLGPDAYGSDEDYEYTGCQQVATTQQNEPVYTEHGAVGSHKDAKGYATRYYHLQHGKNYLTIKANVTGNKAGQDPSVYLDHIVSAINSLQTVSSTSLKARAAY